MGPSPQSVGLHGTGRHSEQVQCCLSRSTEQPKPITHISSFFLFFFFTLVRRCSSYQDFTKIGGSIESMDLPRPPSEEESPYQRHRHISRTLSEPSRLTARRAGPPQSEPRVRRSQSGSRFLRTFYIEKSKKLCFIKVLNCVCVCSCNIVIEISPL